MVGFNYQPGSPTQYAHSPLISILNESGEIVFQQVGLGRGPKEAVEALVKTPQTKRRR